MSLVEFNFGGGQGEEGRPPQKKAKDTVRGSKKREGGESSKRKRNLRSQDSRIYSNFGEKNPRDIPKKENGNEHLKMKAWIMGGKHLYTPGKEKRTITKSRKKELISRDM